MHIWTIEDWEKYLPDYESRRTGFHLRYDKTVNPEVKRAISEFAVWIREEYYFPLRVVAYVKGTRRVKTRDGENVVGIFYEPFSYSEEPHIKIATGDYEELLRKRKKDDVLASILTPLAHELTHYFQWINNIKLTPIGMERQASSYADYILYEYSQTRDHP